MLKRKPVAAMLVIALMAQSASAGDAGMQKLFDDIGAYGNVTGPGAYHAQGMNVVTGGNLFMRFPQKNHSLVKAQLPSLKYGCGGIDLYAGSFSFISKDALVSMMKNIGSSAVAYAFKIALDSISPQINKTLTELQQTVQDLNSMNINSCEAGAAIAKGVNGDWQKTSQYFAQVAGPIIGQYSDQNESRQATQGDNAKVNSAINSISDPEAKRQAKPGNLVWRALSRMPGLDRDDKYILMSLSGTLIFPTDAPSEEPPQYKEAIKMSINHFIRGNENGKIAVYTCLDGTAPDQCLVLGDGEVAVTPFATKVEQKLNKIADKIKTNQALDADDIAFVNVSNIPVYKALAVSTATKNTGLDSVWIQRHADLIAAEYAYQFIYQLARQMNQALLDESITVANLPQETLKTIADNLQRSKAEARDEVRLAYQQVVSVNKIAEEILFMERSMMSSMPANLVANQRFAANAR